MIARPIITITIFPVVSSTTTCTKYFVIKNNSNPNTKESGKEAPEVAPEVAPVSGLDILLSTHNSIYKYCA